jgi:hypothetical protein
LSNIFVIDMPNKITLPSASRDALRKLPEYKYAA